MADIVDTVAEAMWEARHEGTSHSSYENMHSSGKDLYRKMARGVLDAITLESIGYYHHAGMHIHPDSWDGELPEVFILRSNEMV